MDRPEKRRLAVPCAVALLVATACGGDAAVPAIDTLAIGSEAFREGERVIFAFDVEPNGTTVTQIQVDVGRRDNPGSPVFWQERIQAWIEIDGQTQCCWTSPRSITGPFRATLVDDGVVYPKPGDGWDLRAVVTYRRGGENADRTAFGNQVTQLTSPAD